jgi:LppX_LprAFG lipoprotein
MTRLLAGLGVALVALAVAGCGGGGGGTGKDPATVVRESAASTEKVKSFHFTLDISKVPTSAKGLQLTGAEGDARVPDALEAQVSGTFAGFSLSTKLVSVGGKLWIENPLSGSWQSVDVGTTPAFLLDPQKGVLGVMSAMTDLKEDGSEDVGGTSTTRITGKVEAAQVGPLVAANGGTGSVDVTLWIGKDDGILRRIEVAGPVGAGERADAVRTVELSRFGEPVTVEAPEGAS